METRPQPSFKDALRSRFREQSLPILQSDGGIVPAASLWTGSQLWVGRMREEGIGGGSRLWLDHAPGPALLQALLAAWWLECDVALGSLPCGDVDAALVSFGCELVIAGLDHPSVLRPNGVSGPTERGEQPTWPGAPSTHAPWVLGWSDARDAFVSALGREPGTTVEIPRSWTTREVLLGRVIPGIANGSILVEDGWPAARTL